MSEIGTRLFSSVFLFPAEYQRSHYGNEVVCLVSRTKIHLPYSGESKQIKFIYHMQVFISKNEILYYIHLVIKSNLANQIEKSKK